MDAADREHLREIMDERDRRYGERFDAQSTAVNAALAAAEKAVNKAEIAADKRFDAANEFRGQLSDQAASFLPRAEAQVEFSTIREKLDTLAARIERAEGQHVGLKDGWGYLVGAAGLLFALASLVFSLSR